MLEAARGSITGVATVLLPPDAPVRREPPRPPELRGPDFDAKFDSTTLIFDAILNEAGTQARIIAPPFLNMRAAMAAATIRAASTGAECRFEIRDFDRQNQILVDVPAGERELTLESTLGRFSLPLSPSRNDLFRGERVMLTLSKNNDLQWITDWARFYRDAHGATAALVFDNGSTDYTPEELLAALLRVEGLRRVVVVRWPFLHGPPGHGSRRYWDSNFSQLGELEVARWRFLQDVRSVANSDIDELVLSRSGATIFELAEASRSGVVAYHGDWVFGIEGHSRVATPGHPMRFKDYRHVLKPIVKRRWGIVPTYPMRCNMKWTTVPSRSPPNAQWQVHTIKGVWQSRLSHSDLRFRHFREISNSWKYDRNTRESLETGRHLEDPLMTSTFRKVRWDD